MCGFGHEGPDTRHVTMGPTAQALTGLTFLVGLPDRPPAGWSFSYLDHVGGYLGAVAILTGLLHRRRTGRRPAHRRLPARTGHRPVGGDPARRPVQRPPGPAARVPDRQPPAPPARRPPAAPTGPGCRPLGGDLVSDRGPVGRPGRGHGPAPPWTDDPRFRTLAGRVEHADELDATSSAWTEGRDRYEVMDLLPGGRGAGRRRPGRGRPPRARPAAGGPGPLHHARQRRGRPAPPRGRAVPHVGDPAPDRRA